MPTIKSIGEFGLIKQIARKFKHSSHVVLGIGDDAALVKNLSREALLTTDMLVEDVDFSFKTATPESVGRKALAVNLSDIAAMGGLPKYALVSLGIPASAPLSQIEKFLGGISKLAKQFKVDVVGGDLSKAPVWTISVALMGIPGAKTIRRSGARIGDQIYVTGVLGGSIRGKHLNFKPRIQEGAWLAQFGITSMIDVSDGLLQDLGHILGQSKSGAKIELDQIPISRGIKLDRALTDGEDFELLFTVRQEKRRAFEAAWEKKFSTKISCIGVIAPKRDGMIFTKNGKPIQLNFEKKGYQHFL